MTLNEAVIHSLIIEAKAIEVSVEGMRANDRNCGAQYTEQAYLNCSRRLEEIAEEIKQRSVSLSN